MLKEQNLVEINNNFNKVSKNRIITKIMENEKFYILATKDPNDSNNFDPFYICDKDKLQIRHSSIMRFDKFLNLLRDARKNVVWELKG